jgi:FkbM family methyltransferase
MLKKIVIKVFLLMLSIISSFLKIRNYIYGYRILRFGSKHGGWYHYALDRSTNVRMLSAGVGEDVSFDIELLNFYADKSCVIFIDPTPRSISHFENICNSFGSVSTENYNNSGFQNTNSYNLHKIDKNNFIYYPNALWSTYEILKFYAPVNLDHVSFSVTNIQNNYNNNYIEVESIDVATIIQKYDSLDIIKLDIEGAEHEVITRILETKSNVNQILVEYDEIFYPNFFNLKKIISTHKHLIKFGYILLINEGSNFVYILKNFLDKNNVK